MNKHSIIGFVLIFAIFVGYMWWIAPSEEERAEMQRRHDSIMAAYDDSVAMAQMEQQRMDSLVKMAEEGDSNAMRLLNMSSRKVDDMGAFNASAEGDSMAFTVDNGLMTMAVSNKGAMIQQVVLKKYTTYDSNQLELITPSDKNMNLIFSTEDNRVVNTKNLMFAPLVEREGRLVAIAENEKLETTEGDSMRIHMRAYVAVDSAVSEEQYLDFVYTIQPNSYEVGFDIEFHGLQDVVKNVPDMDFEWFNSMNRQEKVDKSSKGSRNRNKDPERFNSNIYYKPLKDDVDRLKDGRDSEKEVKTHVEWVAFKQQFFCAILMSDSCFENASLKLATQSEETKANYLCDMSGDIRLAYDGEQDYAMKMGFYFGPTKFRDLRAMHKGFEKMLPLGWWIFSKFISRYVIIPVFNFLETFNWNYGIIILVLTVLMRLVLFPLTFKSYQSSAITRILRPEIEALNKKYPNQDQMMQKQQEMSKLQKRAGINPMMGCLPLLIQLPILTAMFRFYPASIELRQKSFLWCNDLSTYDSILDFGFNIPLYGDHISLFCLLMFAVQFFYTWYTMKSQEGQMNMPGMKFMMYFMPFMMLFLFNSQSAALNLYYCVSLTITMVQMILIRRFTSEKKVRAHMAAYDAKHKAANGKGQKKSKFQQRLEEMQKMSEQMQKERNKR